MSDRRDGARTSTGATLSCAKSGGERYQRSFGSLFIITGRIEIEPALFDA